MSLFNLALPVFDLLFPLVDPPLVRVLLSQLLSYLLTMFRDQLFPSSDLLSELLCAPHLPPPTEILLTVLASSKPFISSAASAPTGWGVS